jgi:LytTr DNA-binding domain
MSDPPQPRLRETAAFRREAPSAAAHASPAAGAWKVIWARNLGISAAAGVFLALVGAMGTSDAPLTMRLAYWVPLMIAGAAFGHGASLLVARIPRAEASRWLFGALLSVAIALPVTVVVQLYTNALFGADMGLPDLPALFVSVWVISAAMTAIMIAVNWPGRVTHAAPAPGAAPPRFLQRLPPKLRGALLYAISAEDHYLRLHTSKGSDLILMRLADAIAELEGLEGAQTHRSWWVARDAVESARREGERVVLLLKGGAEAPVSRPNVRPLREAGWY